MLVPPSEMRREPVVRAAAHVFHPVKGEEMRASGSGKPVRIEALLFDWCDEVVQRVGLVDDREDDTGHHVELFEGKSSGIGHLHVQQQVRPELLDSGFSDHFARAHPSCRALIVRWRTRGCADARTPGPAAPSGLAAGGAETAFADLARVLISTLRAIGLFLVVPQMPFRPPGAMIRRARVLVLAVWGAGAVIEGASIGGLTVLPAPALAAHPVFPFRIRAVVASP